jgi:Phosphotransferase enzyme family
VAQLPIPETPDELTPEWLTAALNLPRGRVVAVEWERIGQEFGFTGVIGRLRLRYEGADADPPESLVAKLPMAQDEHSSGYRAAQARDPAFAQRYYERSARETTFYREIAPAFAPTLYYAAADEARRRVALLLEDVDGRQGDVIRGCSIDEAALVIDELAPFHARWWGERAPKRGFGVSGPGPQARQERYDARVDHFLKRYGDRLPDAVRDIVVRLRSQLAAIVEALNGRSQTLIHGDLHLDNMIFEARGDPGSVAVLDWQTASVGPPAWDVALSLFDSLSVEDRRAAESELLDRYVTLLAEHGVRGYSVEDLRRECGLALLLLLAGTVLWRASLDPDELSGRERELHGSALAADGRLVAAVLDHDVARLLAR